MKPPFFAGLVLLAAAPVQGQPDLRPELMSPEQLRAEIGRLQRELHKTTLRVQRMLELRIRHELGLPVDADTLFHLSPEERRRDPATAARLLAEADAERGRLARRLEKLRRREKTRRDDLAKTLAARTPPARTMAPEHEKPPAPGIAVARRPVAPAAPTQAPLRETDDTKESRETTPEKSAEQEGVVHLIKGSRDRGLVGRALFLAGRYEDALRELAPFAKDERAPLVWLFWLARCYEELGRYAEADDLFARIEARDTREDEKGKTVLGAWGMAAKTARQHMTWMRERGTWKPKLDVDAIRWRR